MIPMLSLILISSHGIILLRVLFHLIQTISFKCSDHLLVEQTLASINDLKNFGATCNTFNTIDKFNDDRLVFCQRRVGDVTTNGSIALISVFKTFSLFNIITALTFYIPFSLVLLLSSYSGFNRYPYQLLSSYS